jgi:hypothetical protein
MEPMMFKMFRRKKPANKFVEIVSWDGYTVKPVKGQMRIDRIEKSRHEELKNDLLHLQDVRCPERGQEVPRADLAQSTRP